MISNYEIIAIGALVLAGLTMFLDLITYKKSFLASMSFLYGIISLMALVTTDYIAAILACSIALMLLTFENYFS